MGGQGRDEDFTAIVDARIWANGEDPGLQSELRGEDTRPAGGCHEHAARFDRIYAYDRGYGEGPGLNETASIFLENATRPMGG